MPHISRTDNWVLSVALSFALQDALNAMAVAGNCSKTDVVKEAIDLALAEPEAFRAFAQDYPKGQNHFTRGWSLPAEYHRKADQIYIQTGVFGKSRVLRAVIAYLAQKRVQHG